jgi:SAM-dependent methyltransferase
MQEKFSYDQYVTDAKFLDEYNAYQAKYAATVRESDKVIIEIIREEFSRRKSSLAGQRLSVLDIGCSTGNLLMHLKGAFGGTIDLSGGDLAQSSLDMCRANPELEDVKIDVMDIFNLPARCADVIVVNAVLYMFDEEEFKRAWSSLSNASRSGGSVVVYDFAHPFAQDIEIIERTDSHPDGLRLCFRPQSKIQAVVEGAGMRSIEFRPFTLPIDLERRRDDEIITYTVKDEGGRRMAFRGTLFQPWCHMIARKTAT